MWGLHLPQPFASTERGPWENETHTRAELRDSLRNRTGSLIKSDQKLKAHPASELFQLWKPINPLYYKPIWEGFSATTSEDTLTRSSINSQPTLVMVLPLHSPQYVLSHVINNFIIAKSDSFIMRLPAQLYLILLHLNVLFAVLEILHLPGLLLSSLASLSLAPLMILLSWVPFSLLHTFPQSDWQLLTFFL